MESTSGAITASDASATAHSILDFVARIQADVVECLPDGLQDAPQLLRTCVACRTARTKCSGGLICSRCRTKELPCEYAPQKRMGRPVKSAKTVKLQTVQRDLERLHLMLQRALAAPAPVASTSTAEAADVFKIDESPEPEKNTALWQTLTNPLRLLAIATEASSEAASTPTDQEPAPQALAPSVSIFDHVFEDEPQLDPVALGYLSTADWHRLLDFYYDQMHSSLPFLDPALHTATNIRTLSPFLTTAIALCASSYSVGTSEIYVRLEQHILYLSGKVFLEGYKSLEVITAYCIWTGWSPLTPSPPKERVLIHLAEASRIAADIRVHLPLLTSAVEQYRTRLPPGVAISIDQLNLFRQRVQQGLFCREMQSIMQIGRLQSLPLAGSFGFSNADTQNEPQSPKHWDKATLALYHNAATALNNFYQLSNDATLDSKTRRTRFVGSWRQAHLDWQRRLGNQANFSARLAALSHHVVILSFSLRFGGPIVPVLTECYEAALAAVNLAVEHASTSSAVPCALNGDVLNISAAANFLIRFSVLTGQARTPCLTFETKQLCYKAVEVLRAYDRRRLNGLSIASYFANRLETLLSHVLVTDMPAAPDAFALPPLLAPLINFNDPPSTHQGGAPPVDGPPSQPQIQPQPPLAFDPGVPMGTEEWLAQSEAFWAQMAPEADGSFMDLAFTADWPAM
ncbi:hypothetical protein JCM10207_001413 [Rhodosporidiobolus poonsookiae]